MASKYLLETGSDGYLLEDGSGVLIIDDLGASWAAALDTSLSVDVSVANVQKRLRVSIRNTGTAAGGTSYKWQYRKNSGTWTDITASSSNVKTFATSYYADGDDVPQVISSSTYQSDNNAAEESTGTFTLTAGLATSTSFETEITLEFIKADIANGDTLDFRVVTSAGVALDTYTQTPAVTIVEGAATTNAVGTVSAAAAVTTHGIALWKAAGTATATATVTAHGATIVKRAGTVTATTTVTTHGIALWKTAGTASGSAAVTAHGARVIKSAGSVTSAATVTATGKSTAKSVGTITASASVTTHGVAIAKTVGTVTATTVVSAVAIASGPFPAVGAVTMSASVTAAAKALALAGGSSVAVSSVQAISKIILKAAGSVQSQALAQAVGLTRQRISSVGNVGAQFVAQATGTNSAAGAGAAISMNRRHWHRSAAP